MNTTSLSDKEELAKKAQLISLLEDVNYYNEKTIEVLHQQIDVLNEIRGTEKNRLEINSNWQSSLPII